MRCLQFFLSCINMSHAKSFRACSNFRENHLSLLQKRVTRGTYNVQDLLGQMDRYNTFNSPWVMEALSSGQYNKVTRVDTSTGIFDCPKLLYASDSEEEVENPPNAQEENHQNEVETGPAPVEPFQSLEPILNAQFEQSGDQIRRIMALSKWHKYYVS